MSRRSYSRPSGRTQVFWGLHAVASALRSERYTPLELFLSVTGPTVAPLIRLAREHSLPIQNISPLQLKKMSNPNARQAALVCRVSDQSHSARTLREVIASDSSKKESLIVLCDGVTDIHNIGAIIRSAHHFSVSAVVLATRHTPHDEALLAHASTGSSFCVPLVSHQNIANSLTLLREHNYWIIGADTNGTPLHTTNLHYPHRALVVGDEHQGLRTLTRQRCDHLVALPGATSLDSLNVSVATGILLYEFSRPH